MTTTELIKILQDNETGAISLKPREISLFINGIYMPNPQITLSSTGDGICGAEIDLDVCGEWLEQEPCDDAISRAETVKFLANHSNDFEDVKMRMAFQAASSLVNNPHNLPPVNPQPKTVHWIEDAKTYYEELNKRGLGVDEYTPYFTDDIACSECLAKYSMLDNETQFFKHCPNCGARMV